MTDDVRLIQGDCLKALPEIGHVDAVVSDPPYGIAWSTNSKRYSDGHRAIRGGEGRDDWPAIHGDAEPFDPAPWLAFPKVILWGANHYAQCLPTGTTLVWLKKADHLFGTFLSDAELAWMKGGYGVYCYRQQFPPPSRAKESHGRCAHPTQKPVELMRWCLSKLKLPPGAVVLDPYMGSGTTGVAAVSLGLRFVGVEMEPSYFAAARRRIAEAVGPLFAGVTA